MNPMIVLLLTLLWLSQGIPTAPAQGGTVTGTLQTDLGTPAVGVRVAAMARPETAADISYATALASIAETDEKGHFRLENIPPGRYFIAAGRVDYPTYFPGTQDVTAGRIVTIKTGDVVNGIDFAMNSIAARPPDTGFGFGISSTPSFNIPITVGIEGGGGIPVFSASGFTALLLTRTQDGFATAMPLATASFSVAIPTGSTPPEYRIALENLPAGYVVGSMKYGASAITDSTLRLSVTNPPPAATIYSRTSSQPLGAILPPAIVTVSPATPAAGSSLTITLVAAPPSPAPPGVRITGKAPNSEVRSIYISGVPGIYYSDGSFEFRGVPPGRHTIATPDNPTSSKPLGLSIVVGNQDIAGIVLVDTPVLPSNVRRPVPPAPAGTHAPGSVLPLTVIRGRVVNESTQEPIGGGTVFITGHYGSSFNIDTSGKFEIPRLLPGSYELEIQTFGHNTIRQTILVEESDVNLELSTMPL